MTNIFRKDPQVGPQLWLMDSKQELKWKCMKIGITQLKGSTHSYRNSLSSIRDEYNQWIVKSLSRSIFASFVALRKWFTTEGWKKGSLSWTSVSNKTWWAIFNWLFIYHITVNLDYLLVSDDWQDIVCIWKEYITNFVPHTWWGLVFCHTFQNHIST